MFPSGKPNGFTKPTDHFATDFVDVAQKFAQAELQNSSQLCCCEYIDNRKTRSHILGCCCNCEDIDLLCTGIVTCSRINPENYRRMLLTFQDRLRIPWRGGARQVPLENVLPIVVIPLMIAIAAINLYTSIVMLVSLNIFMYYIFTYVQRAQLRTRFFLMWGFWSVVYIATLFEFTAPLQEFLPEENLILILFATSTIFCLWRTKKRAVLNYVVQSSISEDDLPDITEVSAAEEEAAEQITLLMEENNDLTNIVDIRDQPKICTICRKYMPLRTVHCSICGACVRRCDHHSYWLNCCIGKYNHHSYLATLVLGTLTLLLGADLTMTAVCHPYLVVRFFTIPLLLPDDCSEVYEEYILAVCFVIAVYALLMVCCIMVSVCRQFYFISRGTNMHEFQRGERGNRKTCLGNWKSFFFS